MKCFDLLIGLHTAIVTMSPSFADISSGLWALIVLYLFSNLSYFLRNALLSILTLTVFLIFAETTVPVIVLMLGIMVFFAILIILHRLLIPQSPALQGLPSFLLCGRP